MQVNNHREMIHKLHHVMTSLGQNKGDLVTRFAPSPTGYLHLGHVGHMLFVWGIARAVGAKIVFRIEDHDQTRFRPEFLSAISEDLTWLGMSADEGFKINVRPSQFLQSENQDVYQDALTELTTKKLVYSCLCTRKTLDSFSSSPTNERRYLGRCRSLNLPLDTPGSCLRLKVSPPADEVVSDLWYGTIKQNPINQCGDPVIRDRHRQWSYFFAVVIDDLRHHINLIVRGQDLVHTCARQLILRRILRPEAPTPIFIHHPLISDAQGCKLSKRSHADAISLKREQGIPAAVVLSEASYRIGLQPHPNPQSLDKLYDGVFKI